MEKYIGYHRTSPFLTGISIIYGMFPHGGRSPFLMASHQLFPWPSSVANCKRLPEGIIRMILDVGPSHLGYLDPISNIPKDPCNKSCLMGISSIHDIGC